MLQLRTSSSFIIFVHIDFHGPWSMVGNWKQEGCCCCFSFFVVRNRIESHGVVEYPTIIPCDVEYFSLMKKMGLDLCSRTSSCTSTCIDNVAFVCVLCLKKKGMMMMMTQKLSMYSLYN